MRLAVRFHPLDVDRGLSGFPTILRNLLDVRSKAADMGHPTRLKHETSEHPKQPQAIQGSAAAGPATKPTPRQTDKIAKGTASEADLESYFKKDRHFHKTAELKLTAAKQDISNSLAGIRTLRLLGVDAAKTEVSGFKRAPQNEPSLLFSLAMAGLQIASAGIGAALATRLAPVFKRVLSREGWSHQGDEVLPFKTVPAETLLSFLGESVEQSVQMVGAKAIDAAGSGPSSARTSSDPIAEFFRVTGTAITIESMQEAARKAGFKTTQALLPFFEVPEGAELTAAHEAKLKEIDRLAPNIAAAAVDASQIQHDATVAKWVDYVRSTSQAGGDLVGRTQNARDIDGLIDLTFSAGQATPQQPVRITDVRFKGVRKAVVSRFIDRPLASLPLPFRATCFFGPSKSHDQFVSVLRDPTNEIQWSDIPPENGSWLAAKAGVRGRARDEDKQRGARMLVDEIARMSLMQHLQGAAFLGDATKLVDNDSDEP